MAKRKPAKEETETIEQFIDRRFRENFERIRFESGHGLSPEIKEAAKRQVLLYWKRLTDVAESITDTEVRLNLARQQTPKKRSFNIEGIVDIVREEGRTVMYDIKTHDPEYIKKNELEYERQLSVYAHIWQKLRQMELHDTAVIATRLPESLDAAWEDRERNPAVFEEELRKWDPIIPFPFNTQHVENVIDEFARTVDAIEDGMYCPPPVERLSEVEVGKQTFATRVCVNCDMRFSCASYREYIKTSRSRDLPRFRDIYDDTGSEPEREVRKDAGLVTLGPENT